jgi:hypothetical protein
MFVSAKASNGAVIVGELNLTTPGIVAATFKSRQPEILGPFGAAVEAFMAI